ncbi:hypothetical protein OG709_35795 (plasmid) [Streptomyces sp. NBC_01267]|uniref:hypothetical protein n=1 Tax=Streptomyces sp. NBC_01267 TaxID=2903805 RepID=UPI002E37925A|nr:hypothetical protein [Streptomyces sp. NBC_01267]
MSESTEPREPEPVPPLETISDSLRIPPPRRPAPPRPEPIKAVNDIPTGAIITFAVLAIGALVIALAWGAPKAIGWSQHQDWSWATQWAATITDPVHAYLGAHTVGLPITATTVFIIWQAVGVGTLIVAWLSNGFGPRSTWLAYGAATVFMVWDASPAAGRTVAAGLAVIAWTILSSLALRGFSLRPVVNVFHRS